MAGHISALRFQKRTSERVNVFLDGSYAFALPATVAAGLRPGQYLSDEDIARLKALDEQERAYERCLRFLAYRPRSTAEVRRYLAAGVAVGEHLADQLLLPLSLAGGGTFTTLPPTLHFTTNVAVIRRFLPVRVRTEETGPERFEVTVEPE